MNAPGAGAVRARHTIALRQTQLALLCVLGVAAIAEAAPFAYIPSTDGTLSVIDTATNTVTATVQVPGASAAVAVSPDGTRVYVGRQDGYVSVLDAARNTVIDAIAVGGTTFSFGLSPDGKRLYAVNAPKSVAVIDTATKSIIATAAVSAESPGQVVVSPDGTQVYVANTFNAMERQPCTDSIFCFLWISVLDTASNTQVTQLDLGDAINGSLSGIAVDPSGARLYAANTRFDLTTGLAETVSIFVGPFLAERGENADIALRPPIIGLTPGPPGGVAVDPQGRRLYVVLGTEPSVAVVDIANSSVTAAIPIGAFGNGIAVTPDGMHAYVPLSRIPGTSNGANAVAVVDTATNSMMATIPVGPEPVAFGQFIGPENPPFTPLPTASQTPTPTPTPCAGDCNGDGTVTIDELLQGVNIALGTLTLDHCPSLDADHNGVVTVEEIVSAVSNALNGCA